MDFYIQAIKKSELTGANCASVASGYRRTGIALYCDISGKDKSRYNLVAIFENKKFDSVLYYCKSVDLSHVRHAKDYVQ